MDDGNVFGYDKLFNRKFIQTSAWEEDPISYHMFLCHARWNHVEVSFVLKDKGKNDVFYFSFLRDPAELFRSYWDYNRFEAKFGPLNEFISKNLSKGLKQNMNYFWPHGGYNQMLYDFGLEYKDMNDLKKVKLKIKVIDILFDMILFADEKDFEDSITLLKSAINWEYKDIVNLKLNVRETSMKSKLSFEERCILKGNSNKNQNHIFPYE